MTMARQGAKTRQNRWTTSQRRLAASGLGHLVGTLDESRPANEAVGTRVAARRWER